MLKNKSIKLQLVVYFSIVTIIIATVGGYFAYSKLKKEAHSLFDSELIQSGQLLLAVVLAEQGQYDYSKIQHYFDQSHELMEHNNQQVASQLTVYEQDDKHRIGFQVWSTEQKLLFKSTDFPKYRTDNNQLGFSVQAIDNETWRMYSLLGPNGHFIIITGEKLSSRFGIMKEAGEGFIQLFFASFILLLLMLYAVLSFALKPVLQLINDIKKQDVNALTLIPQQGNTQELKLITDSLNHLITRVKDVLEREKKMTSDAAHELRTPLAGIKIHAELALSAENIDDKNESIQKLLEGVDRGTHLVHQLLTLSRLQANINSEENKEIDLHALILKELNALSALVSIKHLIIDQNNLRPISIYGQPDQIVLVIQNILSNAIKFTPDQGQIKVSTRVIKQTVECDIMDNGLGIQPQERELVMGRFYRAKDTQHIQGCGIGLSIVSNILDAMGAQIKLSDSDYETGLKVTLIFPL